MQVPTASLDSHVRRREPLFWVIFFCIILAAVVLRVYDIDYRLFHNDEGVNYHFIKQTREKGYYPYSHENYHGPSYFYLTLLSTHLFGDGEFGMRFSAILIGVLCLFLLLPLRRFEGDRAVLAMAALLAVSSSLVFYARYAIHETLFLFAGAGAGICLYGWHRTRERNYVWLGFFFLGLLIATKETFIITLFYLFFALLSLGDFRGMLRDLWRQRVAFYWGAFLCVLIVLLFFSGGGRWPGGLREMFLAVPQWVGRNTSDVGHHKPFVYYLEVLRNTEPHLFLYPLPALLHIPRFLHTPGSVLFFPAITFVALLSMWEEGRGKLSYPTARKDRVKFILLWFALFIALATTLDRFFNLRVGHVTDLLFPSIGFFLVVYLFSEFRIFGLTIPEHLGKDSVLGHPGSKWCGGLLLFVFSVLVYREVAPGWLLASWLFLLGAVFSFRIDGRESFGLRSLLFLLVFHEVLKFVDGVSGELIVVLIFACYLLLIVGFHLREALSLLCEPESLFYRFFGVWAGLSLLVYCFVKYKTPWLIINMTFPMTILIGSALVAGGRRVERSLGMRWLYLHMFLGVLYLLLRGLVVESAGSDSPLVGMVNFVLAIAFGVINAWFLFRKSWHPTVTRAIAAGGFLAVLMSSLYFTFDYNFVRNHSKDNQFMYVHTTSGMKELADDIRDYWKLHPGSRVLVAVSQYWPFPYYVRQRADLVNYQVTKDLKRYGKTYDVLIMSDSVKVNDPEWARVYYRISDVQESHVYFKRSSE